MTCILKRVEEAELTKGNVKWNKRADKTESSIDHDDSGFDTSDSSDEKTRKQRLRCTIGSGSRASTNQVGRCQFVDLILDDEQFVSVRLYSEQVTSYRSDTTLECQASYTLEMKERPVLSQFYNPYSGQRCDQLSNLRGPILGGYNRTELIMLNGFMFLGGQTKICMQIWSKGGPSVGLNFVYLQHVV